MKKNIPHIAQFDRAYFIGIGGIGMSALSRYFNNLGWQVAGYDKTQTSLTDQLQKEGISIHFEDFGPSIPEYFQDVAKTLVIYTPAIPKNLGELLHVQHKGYALHKRAEILGMITRNSKAIGVAGTHGKTTTSTMLAYILHSSELECNAFLGGIATNFQSNFVSSKTSELTVIEADEFDRSFLQLTPFASIVTSTDADHLDIYGNENEFLEGFQSYVDLIAKDGFLIKHINAKVERENAITYGIDCEADYVGSNLRFSDGKFLFDVQTPTSKWQNVELGIPGIHNAENAVACVATSIQLGLSEGAVRMALQSFEGIKRRFEYHIRTENIVYIDDYAHHPTELNALISSIQLLYPNKKVTGVFQPHLFSRTRDFFEDFAKQLSRLDDLILLPIYPAREEPISGITSEALLEKITCENKQVLSPEDAVNYCAKNDSDIYLTIGAGDIDRIIEPLKRALVKKLRS